MEENQSSAGKFLDPSEIISNLDIENGCTAVDFGCGPGYFSIPFAKAVGSEGKIYSLDILPQALETVISKAKNSGIVNIETKRVNLEKDKGTGLDANFADWVILKDILFQNQKKEVIIAEAYRVLKNGGKAIVVEWNQNDSMVGPSQDIRIPQVTLEKMFSDNKFIVEKNINAGDYHYAFVAVKN
ncbi:MAG: SAM-dependent methyltransferase [uncultured bacterium]|nr:MAG: SAM-dependent methyltransferase [uncultured bacterium]